MAVSARTLGGGVRLVAESVLTAGFEGFDSPGLHHNQVDKMKRFCYL